MYPSHSDLRNKPVKSIYLNALEFIYPKRGGLLKGTSHTVINKKVLSILKHKKSLIGIESHF